MLCPTCGHKNFPGDDVCARCMLPLAPLDLPTGHDAVEASVLGDAISTLNPKTPITIPVDAKLGLALDRMVEHGVGALLVVDAEEKLVGILTERDYLKKVVGIVPDYAHQALRDYMTTEPESVSPDDSIAAAMQKMVIGGYRHIPVLANGHPVGIISVRDVVQHITRLCGSAS
jgi:CBS domain-containing protein